MVCYPVQSRSRYSVRTLFVICSRQSSPLSWLKATEDIMKMEAYVKGELCLYQITVCPCVIILKWFSTPGSTPGYNLTWIYLFTFWDCRPNFLVVWSNLCRMEGMQHAPSKLQPLQTRQKFWRWLAFYLQFTTLSLCHMYSLIGDRIPSRKLLEFDCCVYLADW